MNAACRETCEDERPDIGVDGIVDNRSGANIHEIAEHEKIGSQNEEKENRPTHAKISVEKNAQQQYGAALNVEKNSRTFKHFSRIAQGKRRSGTQGRWERLLGGAGARRIRTESMREVCDGESSRILVVGGWSGRSAGTGAAE